MTLRPALARFERGFRRMGSWTLARVTGARSYRFEGEQEAHADRARQTEISLGLMASASTDPEQIRMASEIEHDAEERLTVLLGKARLTMEEKGERDSIQRAISARRQGFAGAPAPRPLFSGLPAAAGLLGGVRLWMVLLGAWAVTGGVLYGMYGMERAKSARLEIERDAPCTAQEMERLANGTYRTSRRACITAAAWRERSEYYRQGLVAAAAVARSAARDLDAERAAQARAAARERRRNREIQDVLTGSPEPPAWRLRDDGAEDRDRGTPAG